MTKHPPPRNHPDTTNTQRDTYYADAATRGMNYLRTLMGWHQPNPVVSQNPPKTPLTDETAPDCTNTQTPPNQNVT